ncbi:MAG: PAS domain S-box protein, partial [Candidatus Thorarchaeota archaeon]
LGAHDRTIESPNAPHKSGIFQSVVRALTQSRKEQELRFHRLFRNIPIAIAYHRIVLDVDGHPCDFMYEEVNDAFQELTRMKRRDILGKNVTDIIPGIQTSEFDWIGAFEKVVLSGDKIEFEQFLEPLGRWLSVIAYSSGKHCLVTIFADVTEYRAAQETVQRQHDFLERVKESLTHPFYVIDSNDYTIAMANNASGFGVLEDGSTCFALTHQRIAPCNGVDHPCPLQEVKARRKPVVVNHIHCDAAGNSKFFEIHAYPIFDSNGIITKIIEYSLDITERHKAEKALRESEKRHRTLIQSINDMIFVIDAENKFSQNYSASSRMPFASHGELLGKCVVEVLPLDVAQQYLELSKCVRATGNRQNLEYSLDIGESRFWFLTTLDLHEDGESIVSVVRDITIRKKAEEALRRSEASLAEAQKIAHLGNWNWDILTDEVHWSDEVYNIFGVSPQNFSGSYDAFLKFVHPNDRDLVKSSIDRAITKQDPYRIEHRIIKPNGEERILHQQSEVIYDDEGNIIRMIGTVLDITERKRMEKQLQMASRRAMLYLDLMGHDVINQLQIIMSCNALLEQKLGLLENGYLISTINNAVKEIERMVSKARSTELLTEAPLVLRDLLVVMIDCVNAIWEGKNHVIISSEFKVNEAPILADGYLECMLDNLLENAIQHNPSPHPQIWITIQQKHHGYEVSIADNGPGIRGQTKNDLFNPNRRFGGVGLHQVKEIIEKYKGRVEVRDRVPHRPDCGAEFIVWFPETTCRQETRNKGRMNHADKKHS